MMDRTYSLRTVLLFPVLLFCCVTSFGQYKQEDAPKETVFYPDVTFDSVKAMEALGPGHSTITGVAFTKPRNGFGGKAPISNRIYANHVIVALLPVTPYLEAWYDLRKKKENLKKQRYVYLSDEAWYYRFTCETNDKGEFTFPHLKPGLYFLQAIINWSRTSTYDRYTGTGYNSYGGSTDYYVKDHYSTSYSDRVESFVEVKKDGEVVKIKLK